jgi:hypothetical protein
MTTTTFLNIINPIISGTYKGKGEGVYPTIRPFSYLDETTISPLPGKPIFTFQQRTRTVENGEPSHAEQGYIRFIIPKEAKTVEVTNETQEYKVEIILSQPNGKLSPLHQTTLLSSTFSSLPLPLPSAFLYYYLLSFFSLGLASVEEGTATLHNRNRLSLSLTSTSLARSSSSKPPTVTQFSRVFTFSQSGELTYTMDMATEKQPLTRHLEAKLTKQ